MSATIQVTVSTTPSTEPLNETVGFDIPAELHMLDQANRIIAARIRRVGPSVFELSCAERLRDGERLALSHEGRRLEVEVSSTAQSAADIYQLTLKVVNEQHGEVRSEFRLPTDLSAVMRVAGDTTQIPVKIVDMSPSGMGVEVPKSLAKGVKVCINLEQGLAFGEIRFCRQKTAGVFLIGFKLEEYLCQ